MVYLFQIKQGLESCRGVRLCQTVKGLSLRGLRNRQYLMEFKIDAVKLLEERGYAVSEATNSLGIPQANLTKWRTTGTSFGRKQYRERRLVSEHRKVQPTVEDLCCGHTQVPR